MHGAGPISLDAEGPHGRPVSLVTPDTTERSVTLVREGMLMQAVFVRRDGRITVSWPDLSRADLVDASGMLPRTSRDDGVEVREGKVFVRYNLAEAAILPPGHSSAAVPVVLTTPRDNIAEANVVYEPRRWPAYVLVSLGALSALAGTAFLLDDEQEVLAKVLGVPFLLGASAGFIAGGVALVKSQPEVFTLPLPER